MTLSLFSFVNPTPKLRWHPGHYWNPTYSNQDDGTLSGGNIADPSWQTLLDKITPYNNIRGVSWRERWIDLEPTESNYSGIDALEVRCRDLAAINKHFILHLTTRSFSSSDRMAPVWARTVDYEGGDHAYGSAPPTVIEGYNINWHVPSVIARMQLLVQEIVRRLSVYSSFEGIILMEQARGTRIVSGAEDPLTSTEVDAYIEGQYTTICTAKQTDPSILAVWYLNNRTKISSYLPRFQTDKIGLGAPDLFTRPEGHDAWAENDLLWCSACTNKGIYYKFQDMHNIIPLVIHAQPYNYRYDVKALQGTPPTIPEMLGAAKTSPTPNLQVNYLLWTEDFGGGGDPDFQALVLEELANDSNNRDPFGGLNGTVPSVLL